MQPNFAEGCGTQGSEQRHRHLRSFIAELAKTASRPLCVVEVGSYTGQSALVWREAISKYAPKHLGVVFCVDPWLPYASLEDISSSNTIYREMNDTLASGRAYKLFLENTDNRRSLGVPIVPMRMSFAHAATILDGAHFDLIYIDGSHYYQDVKTDIILARHRLVADGGILCGDDLELRGSECDLDIARTLPRTDYAFDTKAGSFFHPGVTLAVHESFEDEFWSADGVWAVRRKKHPFTAGVWTKEIFT